MALKTCTKCLVAKPLEAFHKYCGRSYGNKAPRFGRESRCKACRSILNRAHNEQVRQATFAAYGGKCACCGESETKFLTIDHINNDGSKERTSNKTARAAGVMFYRVLQRRGFPKDNYQLLCWNCNCAKGLWGICPHQVNKDTVLML